MILRTFTQGGRRPGQTYSLAIAVCDPARRLPIERFRVTTILLYYEDYKLCFINR